MSSTLRPFDLISWQRVTIARIYIARSVAGKSSERDSASRRESSIDGPVSRGGPRDCETRISLPERGIYTMSYFLIVFFT
jgi:hypothetical protein